LSPEDQLLLDLGAYSKDPLGFVLWAFPWSEPGSELHDATGPEAWQVEMLEKIRDGLLTLDEALQIAIASGHGIGKSAFVSWLIIWAMSTFPDTRGVVTANTENQLKTKTWAEVAKWFRLFIGRSLFELTATALFSRDPDHEKTWRIDMVPWSERNTEAFAGLHNKGKRILVVFDEGSAIPDVIWETTEGALTDSDTEIIWFVAGNPTRNTGRFRECFGRYSHRWRTKAVDSRTVSITNKKQISKWIADYGEDSDFVRVRVRGQFPRAGTNQFISGDLVDEAFARDVQTHPHDPLILGVDVARFGDDASVIYIRKGRDARTHEPIVRRGLDTMGLASLVAETWFKFKADAVFVDGGGVGGGVVDRLRQLHVPVIEIQFGSKPDRADPNQEDIRYANKRAEMWGSLRAALSTIALWNDQQLKDELVAPEYLLNVRDEIQLERKADMKKRGVPSPDIADALALTFAYPVMPHRMAGYEGAEHRRPPVDFDYDPFSKEYA
jgi:hypothetical protein